MIPNDMFNFNAALAKDTFAVYNICPQWHGTNASNSAWYQIEQQIEKRAWAYGRVYVITGPILDKDPSEYGTIGRRSDIVVPERLYKILISYDGEELAKIEVYIFKHMQEDTESCLISSGLDFVSH